MIHKNQNPLFECQNEFQRRAWLANLHSPMRLSVRRVWRQFVKGVDVTTELLPLVCLVMFLALFAYICS